MTKLEKWEQLFNRAAKKSGHGSCHLISHGGYARPVLHMQGVKGTEDGELVLCTDGDTLGFHRIGLCPFVSMPGGGK